MLLEYVSVQQRKTASDTLLQFTMWDAAQLRSKVCIIEEFDKWFQIPLFSCPSKGSQM